MVGQSLLSQLGSVDLVFIDADHSVTATIADFMMVKDFVSEGGAVVFHDVFNWPTVTEAIEIILSDLHYEDGAHRYWDVDINTGPDGLAVFRRLPNRPSPALTVAVLDSETGAAIPQATVTLIGRASTLTSTAGEAVLFEEVEAGALLDVVADGYQRGRAQVAKATTGGAVDHIVRLTPDRPG
jgi:hypothetical protein